WQPFMHGFDSGLLPLAWSSGHLRSWLRSSIWASTTSSTHSTDFSMWRWRRSLSKASLGGEPGGPLPRLCLPDLPHDRAGKLVGIVVRGNLRVDDIRSN